MLLHLQSRLSVVTNSLAYLNIGLDFSIWAHTNPEVQREHIAHFSLLLKHSRYSRFNSKQKLAKMGVIRKMLFVLRTPWYTTDNLVAFIEAIQMCAEADFSTEDTIKPIVSYLAAHLHSEGNHFNHSL